jgi:hypothetical protein
MHQYQKLVIVAPNVETLMMYKLKNKLTNKTEVHKTLKSIGDKELIHAKTTIDGIKNIKITSTKISKSVKNF